MVCPALLEEVPMLDDRQKEALRQWYRGDDVHHEAKRLIDTEDWENLEELIQMRALFGLSRHSELPDYLKDGDKPLIPSNCNPRQDEEGWKDAVDVGWEVVEADFGLSRDEIHLRIRDWQERSWESFLRSVDERKAAKRSGDR